MKIDCNVEQVHAALPRSKEKAASARTIASTNDWYVAKVTACIETIEAGMAQGLPGEVRHFEAGGQKQYWLEGAGAVEKESKAEPLVDMTWMELVDRLPIGKENAKTIAEITPEMTLDQFYRRVSTARSHAHELGIVIYSEAAAGRNYVYWKEVDIDKKEPVEQRIRKILEDPSVTGELVVKRDGYEVVYRKKID